MDVQNEPLTAYAKSKKEAEKVITEFCTLNKIPFAVARLGSVYGPGEGAYGKVIPTFIRAAIAGKPLSVSDPSARRRFIYVDDVAKKFMYMIENKQTGIVQVTGKKEITIGELAKYINALIQKGSIPRNALEKDLKKETQWFKKQRTIIFDVDGTLIDHTKRQVRMRKEYRTIKERRAHIESTELLALDTVLPGVQETLKKLSREYRLIAVSNRQNGKNLVAELSRFGIAHYFTDIIAVGPVRAKAAKIKAFTQILGTYSLLPDQVTVIGDSDVEKSAASALGIRFVRSTKNI
jgi:FMN phosphatase YigB (HAD superfamily)